MYNSLIRMYVVLDNDNDNHISNQRNTDQESDDEVIEEIMQDGLRRAKMARERLEREEFLQVYYMHVLHEYNIILMLILHVAS